MDNVCEDQVYSSVFRANSKTLFNFIYYKFGNEEKAHDAVQEAFVKLWENCGKVSPEKAKSYLYTVANNTDLNVIKAEKVRLKYAEPTLERSNESPEFLLEEKEYKEKLDNALNHLPENQPFVARGTVPSNIKQAPFSSIESAELLRILHMPDLQRNQAPFDERLKQPLFR